MKGRTMIPVQTRLFLMMTGLYVILAATPAQAHHAFAAQFDANKLVTLRGAVTKMEWVNPHAWIYLDLKKNDRSVGIRDPYPAAKLDSAAVGQPVIEYIQVKMFRGDQSDGILGCGHGFYLNLIAALAQQCLEQDTRVLVVVNTQDLPHGRVRIRAKFIYLKTMGVLVLFARILAQRGMRSMQDTEHNHRCHALNVTNTMRCPRPGLEHWLEAHL